MKAILNSIKSKTGIFKDLIHFFWERKLWWMIPMIIVLLLIGFIIVLSQGSAIAPFIYTLF